MAYTTGTATSPEGLRTAISSFAIRTLGNFDDLFGGALGLSAFGGNSVLGLKHRGTRAAYLFDIIPGLDMNNLSTEHVLLGQLLGEAAGSSTYDANLYFGQEGETLIPLDANGTVAWTTANGQPVEGSSDLFDLTTFVAQVPDGDGPFSGAQIGQALILKTSVVISSVTYSNHVFEILSVSAVEGSAGLNHATLPDPAYSQEIVGTYLGSYNENGTNNVGVVPDGSGVASDFLLSNFSARDQDLLADTAFHKYSSSMWGSGIQVTDLPGGFFPRSGRLNFTSGVDYTFYGSAEIGNEHFHMVLQTVGSDKVSHWWMGRLAGDADSLSTGLNPTGMFLGTTGPHTDEQGVDSYQYPFSYQGANEAYKNPSILIARFSEDGLEDTIQQTSGGRSGYGPLGTNHIRKYGPNDNSSQFLQSKRYSIQAGFNSFQGGEAVGMTGARARTFYPLRPIETEAGKGFDEFYISPWTPVESVLYSLPMPTARASIQTEDAILEAEDIANLVAATGGTALASSGWAEQQFSGADPQTHFWRANGADGLAHAANATYDRIEFRVRQKILSVGGTANSGGNGQIFITTSTATSYADPGNSMLFDHPASFDEGEWTTYSIDPSAMANWTGTITGLRVDLRHYNPAPTTSMRLEWDYISVGQTRLQRNSLYANSNGAYAIHLGQFPGVSRITMNLKQTGLDAKDSSVILEDGHFDTIPVVKRGFVNELQRPLNPTGSSGLAGYVYKR